MVTELRSQATEYHEEHLRNMYGIGSLRIELDEAQEVELMACEDAAYATQELRGSLMHAAGAIRVVHAEEQQFDEHRIRCELACRYETESLRLAHITVESQ